MHSGLGPPASPYFASTRLVTRSASAAVAKPGSGVGVHSGRPSSAGVGPTGRPAALASQYGRVSGSREGTGNASAKAVAHNATADRRTARRANLRTSLPVATRHTRGSLRKHQVGERGGSSGSGRKPRACSEGSRLGRRTPLPYEVRAQCRGHGHSGGQSIASSCAAASSHSRGSGSCSPGSCGPWVLASSFSSLSSWYSWQASWPESSGSSAATGWREPSRQAPRRSNGSPGEARRAWPSSPPGNT